MGQTLHKKKVTLKKKNGSAKGKLTKKKTVKTTSAKPRTKTTR